MVKSQDRVFIACTDIEERKRDEEKLQRDVTEQERLTKALRKSQGELQEIIDLTPQFITVLGPRRERLYINQIGLDHLGTTLDRWRDTHPRVELHPDDMETVQSHWNRAFSNGTAFECEFRSRRKDGIYRWLLARAKPMQDEDGQVLRWYVAFTDIEDRKRDEERLQRENIALREQVNQPSLFEEIVGASAPLQRVLSQVSKVAPADSTVLVTG